MPEHIHDFAAFLDRDGGSGDMNPPASGADITALERKLGRLKRLKRPFSFPPSYRAFLERFDGGIVGDEVWFLTVGEHRLGTSLLVDNDDGFFDYEDIETYAEFSPLLIFATDGGGNFWGFDSNERRADGEMTVVFGDHETGDVVVQADDLGQFLEQIVTGRLEQNDAGTPIDADYREMPRYPEVVQSVRKWK